MTTGMTTGTNTGTNTDMDVTRQLEYIVPELSRSIRGIRVMQMNDPTPCSELTVHGVLDHMYVVGSTLAHLFRGDEPPQISPPAVYGWVPVAELDGVLTDLLEAVSSPGALDRTIEAPIGTVSGDELARFVAIDGLIHGWDVTTATGQPYDPPEELVTAVDDFARTAITPELRDAGLFAEPTTPPESASRLEQLVAFTGRTV